MTCRIVRLGWGRDDAGGIHLLSAGRGDRMTTSYADFLARKRRAAPQYGQPCRVDDVHPNLHDWQRRVVAWAVGRGRAALWETTGAGKTRQQIEWARLSGARSLIIAPLAVCQQTVREAAVLDVPARYVRSDADAAGPGMWVTNYEMFDRFDPAHLDAVVLDEASILKQSDGKTRTALIRHFRETPRRLTATATPAPNDIEELTNQAEFLGVTTRVEMLAAYFVHDDTGWRLKGHARRPMFDWMATWAVALRRPSDIGGSDDGYILPGLSIIPEIVDSDIPPADGQLFRADLGGVGGRAQIRRETLDARVARAVALVNNSHGLSSKLAASETPLGESSQSTTVTTPAGSMASSAPPATSASGSSATTPPFSGGQRTTSLEPWIIWCGLNAEQEAIAAALGDRAISITGSMSPEEKVRLLYAWIDGERPVMVSKTSILGMGINAQHCARMAFVGLSDSWEQYYQAIRRCWRYGQTRPVHAHVVLSDLESAIAANVARKEQDAERMAAELVRAMHTTEHWSAA